MRLIHRLRIPELTLVALGLIFGLLLAEVILRLVFPDALLRHEQQVRFPRGSDFYEYRTRYYRIEGDGIGNMHNPDHPDFNDCGVYGGDIPVRKEAGSFRILFLGDSVTDPCASGSPPDGFTFVTENHLNALDSNRHFIGLNAGVGGFNTEQELAWLKKYGLQMEPDLIVLAYVNNDNSLPERYRLEGDDLVFDFYRELAIPLVFGSDRASEFLLRASRLARLGFISLENLRQALGLPPTIEHFLQEDVRHFRALEELRGLAQSRDIPLVIVHFPFFVDFSTYQRSQYFPYHSRIAEFAAHHDIPHLDLWRIYQRYPGQILYDPEDLKKCDVASHPNSAGHRIAGEALADFLAKTGLLPLSPPRPADPVRQTRSPDETDDGSSRKL